METNDAGVGAFDNVIGVEDAWFVAAVATSDVFETSRVHAIHAIGRTHQEANLTLVDIKRLTR